MKFRALNDLVEASFTDLRHRESESVLLVSVLRTFLCDSTKSFAFSKLDGVTNRFMGFVAEKKCLALPK